MHSSAKELVTVSGGLESAKASLSGLAEQANAALDALSPNSYTAALRLLVKLFMV